MPTHRSAGKWVVAMAGATLAAGTAGLVQADITIQQQVNVDGFGPSKFGAMEGKSSTAISGDKARTEQQSQFKSRLLRALAKGGNVNTVRIIRLDAETIDEIDVTKQQYSEETFQQMRDQMTRAMQSAQNSQNSQQAQEQKEAPSGAPVDDSKCQWSPPKTEVKQTGEHATIVGADASRSTITVTTTCTDPTKGTSCDFVFLLDEWLVSDVPGTAETRAFWAAYAQKLNLSGVLADSMQSNSPGVFSRYQGSWGEAIKQAGTLKGYPMKSVFAMQFGGPQCKDNNSGNSSSSGGADNSGSSSSSSSGGSIPTSPSAAISGAAMGLFNKLHKKDDSQQQPAQNQAAPGMVQMFQMSTETVAISTSAVPATAFEVPAGYKKVEKAGMQSQ